MSVCLRQLRKAAWVAAILAVPLTVAPTVNAALPAHGRAWELVTPGPTNGVNLLSTRAWSSDGDRVVYASAGPMAGAPSGDLFAHGLATRTTGGWTQQPIGEPFTVPTLDLQTSRPLAISSDLSSWLWRSTQPLLPDAPPASDIGLYIRDPAGRLTLLGAAGSQNAFAFGGASGNLQHAVFQSKAHLLAADAGRISGGDAYEFAGSELRLVGVDSVGTPISACGSAVGNGNNSMLLRAVSGNGARIFFSAPANGDCGVPRGVYLRADGSHTIEISASACSRPDCNAPQDATFVGALPDGSSAFLITGQQLTDDDVDEGADLYRYDVADHTLTRISAGPSGATANTSGTGIRASDDGTRVYFVASGALVAGQGEQDRPNLYLSDHGQLRFVATADEFDLLNAAITNEGQTLAFATSTALLPSDADSSVDVYRYDAAADSLEEISIGMGGSGNGAFDVSFGASGALAPLGPNGPRYLSTSGQRVFFVTPEPLVPEDINETADVYERADDLLGLVTSGAGDSTVAYGGASADGRSVFFTTNETLVAHDRNGGDQDLYVARLGGGFPDPPKAPPECEGDACQGTPTSRIERPQPGSFTQVMPSRPFRIRPLGRRVKHLAATGHATIVVDVPVAGRLSIVGRARIGGRSKVVARETMAVQGSTSVRLKLRLSAAARRSLQRRHELRLTLVVRHSRLAAVPSMALTLRSAA